jgi:hypothetical protein
MYPAERMNAPSGSIQLPLTPNVQYYTSTAQTVVESPKVKTHLGTPNDVRMFPQPIMTKAIPISHDAQDRKEEEQLEAMALYREIVMYQRIKQSASSASTSTSGSQHPPVTAPLQPPSLMKAEDFSLYPRRPLLTDDLYSMISAGHHFSKSHGDCRSVGAFLDDYTFDSTLAAAGDAESDEGVFELDL